MVILVVDKVSSRPPEGALVPLNSQAIKPAPKRRERAKYYAGKSKAPSTLRAYSSRWEGFKKFAAEEGVTPLPASPGTVSDYLAALADAGRRPSTISGHAAAIAAAHRLAGLESPTTHEMCKATLQGIRRDLKVKPRRAAPLTVGILRQICAELGDSIIEIRDRALLTLAFAIAARVSEVAALTVDEVRETERGLEVTILTSKTDQEGESATIPVLRGTNPATDPVAALRAWLEASGITEGSLFRAVDRHRNVGESLQPRAVARVVRRRVAQVLGVDEASRYSGHSIRAGMITTAANLGIPTHKIREISRHASTQIVESVYVRPATLWSRAIQCGL